MLEKRIPYPLIYSELHSDDEFFPKHGWQLCPAAQYDEDAMNIYRDLSFLSALCLMTLL